MDTHDIPVSLSEDCCLGILEFIFSPSIQNVLDYNNIKNKINEVSYIKDHWKKYNDVHLINKKIKKLKSQ